VKKLLKNFVSTKYLLGNGEASDCDLVKAEILIENNLIKKVSFESIAEDVDLVIDCEGHFLSPGLCDPQVHFREPGLEYKEDIESGSKAAVKGGFTTVISMPNTSPTADNAETVKYMVKKSKEVGICRVIPTGSVTLGLLGKELTNFEELINAGAIALTDDGKGIQSDEVFAEAMKRVAKYHVPLLDHSEDESLSNGGAIHKGNISEKFNVKAIDSNSEAAHVKRGCVLSEQTGAHFHVLHVSTKKSINFIKEAKRKNINITVEVSPHHLLLCDEDIPVKSDGTLNANWKMNPPLRSKEDQAACIEALLDGTIDAIATDHAPHAPYEKDLAIESAPFGIIGLETAFPLMYSNFVTKGKLSINRLVDLMSKDAGNLFNLKMGLMAEGVVADLALFDLDNEFEVNNNFFRSKSINSPFIGEKLKGATKLTIFEGKVVYNNL
jgi:dihydroorotase